MLSELNDEKLKQEEQINQLKEEKKKKDKEIEVLKKEIENYTKNLNEKQIEIQKLQSELKQLQLEGGIIKEYIIVIKMEYIEKQLKMIENQKNEKEKLNAEFNEIRLSKLNKDEATLELQNQLNLYKQQVIY